MKAQLKIAGSKVHDVGYRYFLMTAAMSFSIQNYNAYNVMLGEIQAIIVEVDGDENRISQFIDYARDNMPPKAQVSDIKIAPMEGYIMRIGEYAMFCTATQLNKAIPLLLDIRDAIVAVGQEVKAVGQDVKAVGQEVKAVGQDVKAVGQEVKAVGQDVKAVGQEVKAVGQDVKAVGQEVKAVGQDVNAVGQEVKAVGQDVKEMSQELKSIGKDIGSLKEGQSEIISSLRDMHEDNNEKFAGMTCDICSIKTKLKLAD